MVIFWFNELSESRKDNADVEAYVTEGLHSHIKMACMTFKERALYPLDEGLNSRSVQALLSFITNQVL